MSFAPVFSEPSLGNFMTLVAGWVFCLGRHTVTGLIVAAGAIGKKHFSCYHRFFSRAVWNLDSVGRVVLKLALSLIVPFPFAPGKCFALPFLFRLYRKRKKKRPPGRPKGERKSTGEAAAREYRTRPELASEMLGTAAEWLPGRSIRVVGDSEYSGKSVSRSLPEGVNLVGRMPMNAALYAEPGPRKPHQRGRVRRTQPMPSDERGLGDCRGSSVAEVWWSMQPATPAAQRGFERHQT